MIKGYEFWLDNGKTNRRLQFKTRAEAERVRKRYFNKGNYGVTKVFKIGKKHYKAMARKTIRSASKIGGKIVNWGASVNNRLGGGFG